MKYILKKMYLQTWHQCTIKKKLFNIFNKKKKDNNII